MTKIMIMLEFVLEFTLFWGSALLLSTLIGAAAFYPTLYTDAYNVFSSLYTWFSGLLGGT